MSRSKSWQRISDCLSSFAWLRDLARVLWIVGLLFLATAPQAAPTGAFNAPGASENTDKSDNGDDDALQVDLDSRLYGDDGELRDGAIGDLDNPHGTLMNLLVAAGGGDYTQAAKSLQLPGDATHQEAADLAGKLTYVLRQRLNLADDVLPKKPDGLRKAEREEGQEPRESILLSTFEVAGEQVPVRPVRTSADDEVRWLFDSQTVKGTPLLYDNTGMGRLISVFPFYRVKYELLGTGSFRLALAVATIIASMLLAWAIRSAALRLTGRLLPKRVVKDWLPFLLRYMGRGVLTLVFFLLLSTVFRPLVLLPPQWNDLYDSLVYVGVVGSITWLLINVVRMYLSAYGARKLRRLKDKSVFLARTYDTKMTVLSRSMIGVIFFIGTVVALSTFDWFASLGLSLLASAGLISVVIGIGAQRTIANLFAGLQIALTQPMRIGDMVIFKGEWGYIENITYTYVVIRIWDLRRLTVPSTMLIDEPVYNYSYADEEGDLNIYGEVYLYLDYTVPIDPIREKLAELVKGDDNHDGEVASVLVTDCRDWNIEVRVLVSATDGLAAWYLRCKVREGLIRFLQDYEDGRYLPRSRVVLERESGEGRPSGEKADAASEETPRQSQEERRGVGERPDDLGEESRSDARSG